MSWVIVWTPRALKDLRRLDSQVARRVGRALDRFAGTEEGDVLRLEGVDPAQWRLRVGDYRVRFQFDRETSSMEIIRVLPRGRAYRD